MATGYEFFEHTADIGVRVWGASREELFRNAAAALYAALGELTVAGPVVERRLELAAPTAEDLLHDWLAELLFELEHRQMRYQRITFGRLTDTQLQAQLQGEPIDLRRSRLAEEIKAVTYHQLQIAQTAPARWEATIIFDV